MSGRHRGATTMHTDDPVAPGIRRSRAAVITALGLVIVLAAIVGIALSLSRGVESAQDSAQLSQDETRQLREFLADRGKQRDDERRETQAQLDQQRAVLCAAIRTLEQSARPEPRKVLAKAATDLRCAALPTSLRPSTSSTPSSTTSTSPAPPPAAVPSPSGTTPSGKGRGRPAATPAASPTRGATPPVTTTPSPAPTTPTPADPIVGPICLLGVCL